MFCGRDRRKLVRVGGVWTHVVHVDSESRCSDDLCSVAKRVGR